MLSYLLKDSLDFPGFTKLWVQPVIATMPQNQFRPIRQLQLR